MSNVPTLHCAYVLSEYADGKAYFNPFASPQLDNPYPIYEHLRSEAPVFYESTLDMWIVTRYKDITDVLNDPNRFSSLETFDPASKLPPAVLDVLKDAYPGSMGSLSSTDPPRTCASPSPCSSCFHQEYEK